MVRKGKRERERRRNCRKTWRVQEKRRRACGGFWGAEARQRHSSGLAQHTGDGDSEGAIPSGDDEEFCFVKFKDARAPVQQAVASGLKDSLEGRLSADGQSWRERAGGQESRRVDGRL